jgi:hypothetical protein
VWLFPAAFANNTAYHLTVAAQLALGHPDGSRHKAQAHMILVADRHGEEAAMTR